MRSVGNYTEQKEQNFPLDAEGLLSIQNNVAACELLGAIAGDKAIITGCDANDSGTMRSAGWVWLKTLKCKDGELLYWEGGSTGDGMYVRSRAVAVEAEGYKYPQAYTERVLSPGRGVDSYDWKDFHRAESTAEMRRVIDANTAAIAGIKGVPAGVIEMWAGVVAPGGYLLCDGRSLPIADYSELYRAIGTRFNSVANWAGVVSAVDSGMFKLPDLRGRFVVGYNADDNEYKTPGAIGGEKKHVLTVAEIPEHKHNFKDYYYIENGNAGIDGADATNGTVQGGGDTDGDNNSLWYKKHDTEIAGGGAGHENRPPYYALAYIIKI